MKRCDFEIINYQNITDMNERNKLTNWQKLSNALLRIVTNRIFVGLVLNIVYFIGIIGTYFTWCVEGNATDWAWWVKLIIFAILINVHRDIYKLITKYGW
jgi:hypothetical protein